MIDFATKYGFKLVHSASYHAQANGQAEVTNKCLILNIQKVV